MIITAGQKNFTELNKEIRACADADAPSLLTPRPLVKQSVTDV